MYLAVRAVGSNIFAIFLKVPAAGSTILVIFLRVRCTLHYVDRSDNHSRYRTKKSLHVWPFKMDPILDPATCGLHIDKKTLMKTQLLHCLRGL